MKGNSPGGVSNSDPRSDICESNLNQSPDRTPKARTAPLLGAPSVPSPFGECLSDKRRRLLSTPLLTGYYVSDRPPDGPSHNSKEC